MKALSFRQPWAELILQGRKTLDLRTYSRDYRGPLAIHASLEIERAACVQHGLDPDALPTGGVVGIVELVDITPLDKAGYAARSAEHLAGRSYRTPMYGWALRDPQRLPQMIPLRGQRNLFTVDLVVSAGEAASSPNGSLSSLAVEPVPASSDDSEGTSQARPFELQVVPDPQATAATGYALTLRQRVVQPADDHLYAREPARLTSVVNLGGDTLRAVADHVMDALRQAGYKPTDLGPSRKAPFYLPEAVGVRLGLVMLAVKPLSKAGRIEAISHGIRTMPPEEAYYWYSKCTARDAAERAQKALRVLLAGE
jgi:hypothetical protein